MSTSLPERPDLDQLRRQAKELRHAVRRADGVALRRFAGHRPNGGQGPVSLAAAQLVIARELGYSSWPKLKAAVDAAAAGPDARDHAFVAGPDDRHLALGAAVYADDAGAVSLLLEACRVATGDPSTEATRGLADAAAANASHEVVGVLLAAGADPDVHDSDVGLSALRCAIRAGDEETAALLVRHGASDDSTDVDRFMGACRRADRALARRLLAEHADLPDRLTDDDRAAMVGVAGSAPSAAVELMLESGFSPHDRNGFGEHPLHTAAYQGNAAVVRVLLRAGADVDARDGRFDSTPLAFATVGSGEQVGKPGDWIEAVRLLIEAGASRTNVWISAKPPSEEVMEILREYGISPADAAHQQPEDEAELHGSIGTGVIADIARHLEAAYRDRDLDLLASLLHPQVHWTGFCQNIAQVLDWYRGLLADGVVPTVHSVEVDRDAGHVRPAC